MSDLGRKLLAPLEFILCMVFKFIDGDEVENRRINVNANTDTART
jgi:hypothetical protein